MKTSLITLCVLLITLLSACKATEQEAMKLSDHTPFGVIYAKTTPEQVQNYNMVIIEPDHYTKAEIDALQATGTSIIAYITLGEVDKNRWYFPLLEERGFAGINENWDSPYLDLSDDSTRAILLELVLPEIMVKGVDGLFMDTIDAVAPYTDRNEMQPYMVDIIKGIRERYPNTTIIQNAGFFLLDQSAEDINAVLIEDIATNYNFSTREYILREYTEYQERVAYLREYTNRYELPFFIIDFADDLERVQEVRSRLDSLKFPYFISNIGLSELPFNPDEVSNVVSD